MGGQNEGGAQVPMDMVCAVRVSTTEPVGARGSLWGSVGSVEARGFSPTRWERSVGRGAVSGCSFLPRPH